MPRPPEPAGAARCASAARAAGPSRRAARALLVAATLLAGGAPGASADMLDGPPAWPRPRVVPVAAWDADAPPVPAMLSVPPGWRRGAPVAVVVSQNPWPEAWKDDLADALTRAGAAVLELDVHSPRGDGPDERGAVADWAPRDLLPDLFAALRALRGGPLDGAGGVVVLGDGRAGEGALLAASEAEAERFGGRGAARFSAGAALGWGCRMAAPAPAGPAGPRLDWRREALREGVALAARGPRAGRLSAQAILCAVALLPLPAAVAAAAAGRP